MFKSRVLQALCLMSRGNMVNEDILLFREAT